ncbi:hypothetical protein Trydic_g15322 [Trypoxylus dichotomus]
MPGVNIACNIGNQLGNGSGEMKFEVAEKEEVSSLANCIASEIVNEILENALDIATMRGVPGIECDTIAFSVDDGICTFANSGLNQKMAKLEDNVEEINDECAGIKDIIDGLSGIHISKTNISKAEEPLRLDVEMKRLLSEIMSPPYDIVNYETLMRKDGVGDQPVEDFVVCDGEGVDQQDDDCLVDIEKIKVVEKKTRVTDLVMNSKQVLSEYLMSDESRKQQEEWEEKNEKVIQVIELDYIKPEESALLKRREDIEEDVQEKEEEEEEDDFVLPIENDHLDNVDLGVFKQDADTVTEKQDGDSENFEENVNTKKSETPTTSSSKSCSLDTAMAKEICKRKFENLKKKKWNINFKFWGFGKKKSRDKEEEAKYVPVDK